MTARGALRRRRCAHSIGYWSWPGDAAHIGMSSQGSRGAPRSVAESASIDTLPGLAMHQQDVARHHCHRRLPLSLPAATATVGWVGLGMRLHPPSTLLMAASLVFAASSSLPLSALLSTGFETPSTGPAITAFFRTRRPGTRPVRDH